MTSKSLGASASVYRRRTALTLTILTLYLLSVVEAFAHNVTEGDAGYIQEIWGVKIVPFMYLGAKHMITGYDHILFLLERDVAVYVSLFALGHSSTMLLGVWYGWGINAYIVDAIIGLSVVYKALDNLGAYQRWFGYQPNTKLATLIFGFIHGTGLATKILDYEMAEDGLLANLIAFNVGVEIGQILALAVILIVMGYWRKSRNFYRDAYTANVIMMAIGFILIGYQITGFIVA